MQQHQGFSPFSWALALFCLPSALFPLTWFLSPAFSNHPELSDVQINLFSVAFWVYPLVLLTTAALLFKLHQKCATAARLLLALGFIAFYLCAWHIVQFF